MILFAANVAVSSASSMTGEVTTTASPIPMFLGIAFYFLPVIIALSRKHYNWVGIAITNVFLGWTIVGWVIALVWSLGLTKKQSSSEMPETVLRAAGVNGQMYLTEDEVIITRKGMLGFMTQGFKGSKHIPISSITSVQLKDVGAIANGFIQLGVLGGFESRGGAFAAAGDENSVTFSQSQQEPFRTIAKTIRERIAMRSKPQPAPSVQSSSADELARWADLLAKGAITQEEYDAKKKQLLEL